MELVGGSANFAMVQVLSLDPADIINGLPRIKGDRLVIGVDVEERELDGRDCGTGDPVELCEICQ